MPWPSERFARHDGARVAARSEPYAGTLLQRSDDGVAALTPPPPRNVAAIALAAAVLGAAGCARLPAAPPPVLPPSAAPSPAPVPAPVPATAPVELSVPAVPAPAPPAPEQQALAELLAWHGRLHRAPAPELAAELARLEAKLAAQPPTAEPGAALQLAWLLARLARNGDTARALALTEALVQHDAPVAWQPAAHWLRERLAAQRALEEQLERQAQQLRDQQRRLEQLQAQIDALRAIERSLGTRPATP